MSTTIKRITVLCDGTGQDGTVKEEERHSNIYRLLRLINDKAGEIEQRVHYQAGIGSAKDFYSKHFDGLVAATLGKQINEAYKFIVDNFQPGDEIFLFGFSRGAYIAMIVAQIIGKIGVLGIVDFPEFQTIYENYVQLGKASSDKDMRESEAKLRPWTENDAPGKRRVSKNGEFSVKCLGLFDPVAATGTDPFRNLLGLPMKKNKIGLSRGELELSALVRDLEPHIEYTYQALAINERREIFVRTRAVLSW
ncbi:hypothetical protein L208DRAFT_418712 [Tricholoma matsutake]|nr:hypothetical protein L208DRAFT_418712 [Tricholoma matsutake 945]